MKSQARKCRWLFGNLLPVPKSTVPLQSKKGQSQAAFRPIMIFLGSNYQLPFLPGWSPRHPRVFLELPPTCLGDRVSQHIQQVSPQLQSPTVLLPVLILQVSWHSSLFLNKPLFIDQFLLLFSSLIFFPPTADPLEEAQNQLGEGLSREATQRERENEPEMTD